MEARRRRIRISFSDPDATDSDSGEDATSASCGKPKIVILHCSSSTSARKNPGGGCGSQQKEAVRSSSAMSCRERIVGSPPIKRCRGVYERQPGRWAAEFRSQRLKARHWIGTFATEEEAKAAYDDFEQQFVPSRRCGLPLPLPLPALQRDARAAGVHRPSYPHRRQRYPRPPDTKKRQIVQALTAARVMLPPLPLASEPARAQPCVSSSTWASPPPPTVPPTPFENINAQPLADALPSVHSFWADEPVDEDLVGLADLGHLPLPFSDGSLDFDPADLSLFDGFL